jgi:alkylation response protein AidB-like acyl-CoA dehydrogenase
MDFSVSREQSALRQSLIEFARAELNTDVIARDAAQEFPRDLWNRCGERRLQGLPVPQQYGGLGLDPLSCAMAMEALGYGCEDNGLLFAISAHLVASVVPIWTYGTEAQRSKYLPGMCDGSIVGCNAITEPGTGSDAFSMTTRAEKCEGGYRLSGVKKFISNAPVADLAIIYAVSDEQKRSHGGITAFLVERGTPGFEVTCNKFDKMGLRTVLMGELTLSDVYVAEEAVLGKIGQGANAFMHSMDWERICLFATHIGTMERLLEQSVAHAKTRKQFGQSIGKYQAISHRIADMRVSLEAARLLIYRGAWNLGRSTGASLDASIAKLFTSEAYVEAALATSQIHGAMGYLTEFGIERMVRDAIGSTIYSGTSEIQRNIIARWLGL